MIDGKDSKSDATRSAARGYASDAPGDFNDGLTPEQRRYLEIVKAEREKNGGKRPKNSQYGDVKKPKKKKRDILDDDDRNVKKKKTSSKVIVAIICLLIIGICFGLLAWLYFSKMVSKLDTVKTIDKEFEVNKTVEKQLSDYRNVAILGSDGRMGEGFDGTRTDAIIIARIHKKTGKIHVISVMRDSYLEIKDSNGQKKLDKITHAHAFGGGVDTCASLNRSLDLNIGEFVIFSWQAVADLVDSMGGVEVEVRDEELADLERYGYETARNVGKTYDPVYQSGKQTLDGVQAATYCRIRKTSGGDPGRGRRMKAVLTSLVKKAKEKSISDLNKVADKVFPEIRTNISKGGILKTMTKVGSYKIEKSYGWPKKYYGGILNGTWYTIPKTLDSQVKMLHKKAFGQKTYNLTERAERISDQIIEQTGVE